MTYLELLKELESSINSNEYMEEEIKNKCSEYLTFILNNEVYAISVDRLEELIPLEHILITGEGSEYKKGLIRYKDGIIEVIDLRLRLNINPKNYDYKSTVIVANKNDKLIGLIVDDVIDFFSNKKENSSLNKETDYFIQGTFKDDKTEIKILDMDNVLNFD